MYMHVEILCACNVALCMKWDFWSRVRNSELCACQYLRGLIIQWIILWTDAVAGNMKHFYVIMITYSFKFSQIQFTTSKV